MKPRFAISLLAACLPAGICHAAAPSSTEFLRLLFGAPDVKIEEVCVPHPDLWMLLGPKHEPGLAEVAQLKIEPKPDRVVWETVGGGTCIFELRDGKADARFLLDQVYVRHRRTLLLFVYHSLRHHQGDLAEVTTDPDKVRFGQTRPAADGDLDVLEGVITQLPVVRVSSPAEDRESKNVTYLLPLGPRGFAVRLVKRERSWLVDSSRGIDVPLEVFYEQSKERRVVYPQR